MQNQFLGIGVKPVWAYMGCSQDELGEYIAERVENLPLLMNLEKKFVYPVMKTAEQCSIRPGFTIIGGHQKECEDLTTYLHGLGMMPARQDEAEIIFFISPAFNFMNEKDVRQLKTLLKRLPIWEKQEENPAGELSNLFILAGQSHTVFRDIYTLNKILSYGYEQLVAALEPDFWEERRMVSGYKEKGSTEDALAKRFYTFSSEDPNGLSLRFYQEVRLFSAMLPQIVMKHAKTEISQVITNLLSDMEEELQLQEDRLKTENITVYQRDCLKNTICSMKKLIAFYERLIR